MSFSNFIKKKSYFDKSDMKQDNYDILKASCSLPFVCRPYVVDGVPYYGGALGDPIPVEKAFFMECEKIVLILTRLRDFRRTADRDKKIAALIRRKYPAAAAAVIYIILAVFHVQVVTLFNSEPELVAMASGALPGAGAARRNMGVGFSGSGRGGYADSYRCNPGLGRHILLSIQTVSLRQS